MLGVDRVYLRLACSPGSQAGAEQDGQWQLPSGLCVQPPGAPTLKCSSGGEVSRGVHRALLGNPTRQGSPQLQDTGPWGQDPKLLTFQDALHLAWVLFQGTGKGASPSGCMCLFLFKVAPPSSRLGIPCPVWDSPRKRWTFYSVLMDSSFCGAQGGAGSAEGSSSETDRALGHLPVVTEMPRWEQGGGVTRLFSWTLLM